jgi:CubicO group peptidase (beta-lactamase class C family)
VYDLASITKVAATLPALMVQYDENRFNLTDRISVHLPELQHSNKKNIIIRDMLYHRSGLPPVINFHLKTIDNTSYRGGLFSPKPGRHYPIRFDAKNYVRNDFTFLPQLVSTTRKPQYNTEVARNFYLHDSFQDSIMASIKSVPLGRPGRTAYSCLNFILLRMVVERQTGQPMDVWLHEHLYSRLGAHTTTYRPLRVMDAAQIVPTEDDRYLRRQLLHGYVHDEMAAFQGGVSGNAGLFSTAEDLAKVLQLYLNEGSYGGERFFSVETARLFTQNKSPSSRRGLGFDKPSPAGHPSLCSMLAHSSTYGHTGYTGTCFWVDPHSKLLYIFLSNHVNPTRANNKLLTLGIRKRVQDAIYKSMVRK